MANEECMYFISNFYVFYFFFEKELGYQMVFRINIVRIKIKGLY